MSAPELRATASLAAIFALRMLRLFMFMPVFSVYAKTIKGGGNNILLVRIALGAYGATQSLLYIFYGWVRQDRLQAGHRHRASDLFDWYLSCSRSSQN